MGYTSLFGPVSTTSGSYVRENLRTSSRIQLRPRYGLGNAASPKPYPLIMAILTSQPFERDVRGEEDLIPFLSRATLG